MDSFCSVFALQQGIGLVCISGGEPMAHVPQHAFCIIENS